MGTSWEVTPEKVQAAVEKIIETAQPRQIILFGSYVRGRMHRDSDLDVLVVAGEPVDNPRKESVRIRRALRGIGMPMDILVVAEGRLRELAEAPGLIYREALREGRVVYDRQG
jgi:predicted nucleotidyltransferase